MPANFLDFNCIEPFWVWLLGLAEAGHIKMPIEIYDEVAGS